MRVHALEELQQLGVNTYITGITMNTPYNSSAHNFAREHEINIIGGTHYSTEKYAMINLVNWIEEEFGIRSEFITEQPEMKDIDT